jgi:hypothetical protein
LDNGAGQVVAELMRIVELRVHIEEVPLLITIQEESRDVCVVGGIVCGLG